MVEVLWLVLPLYAWQPCHHGSVTLSIHRPALELTHQIHELYVNTVILAGGFGDEK